MLDVDAVRAVTRLIDRGFEAYLVGGCVRDLLLGRPAKDYDIATAARPPQVKRTFPRNCRIIGRRFKLAHLHFHGNTKILECSTFRRNPQEGERDADSDDLLITRDNEFGTAEEDALRRDFTINALFLDPTKDKIVDHVHGLEDIEARVIRTIGDPVVRFREDPVRILRAAKFAGRLGFEIEPQTLRAMAETAEDLVRAAPPRLLEEILRLLRSGHALPSFQLLRDVDALRHLIPVVGDFLEHADDAHRSRFWALLEALDRHIQSLDGADPPPNGVLLSVLTYGAVAAECERHATRSASSVAEELLGSLAVDLRLPRRDSGCLKRACGVQHRFTQDEATRRFRIDSFVHSPYFAESLLLFELRTAAEGGDPEVVAHWRKLAGLPAAGGERPAGHAEDLESSEAPRKKRRRRRRRRRDDDDSERDADERDAGDLTEGQEHSANDGSVNDGSVNDGEAEGAADGVTASDTDDDAEPAPRKKRRRRRTRKADATEAAFPTSEEPAPHGDPVVARPTRSHADDELADVTFPLDDGADDGADDDANEGADGQERPQSADVDEQPVDEERSETDETDDETDAVPRPKKRRRRGRRGRGNAKTADENAPADVEAKGGADADGGEPARPRAAKVRGKKAQKKTANRRERRSKKPGGRDVDVVPRYRDRRGKVEVIEPVDLDLSAFDVELDPKRVPTFGSIVEGKGKPKRRGPRIKDDDYRPPPPPGHDDTPGVPPPPPPDDSDTFGDW